MQEEEEEEEEVSLVLQVADRQSSQMENLLELFPFDHSPKRVVFLCRHHCREGALSYGFLPPVHELAALLPLILRALKVHRRKKP